MKKVLLLTFIFLCIFSQQQIHAQNLPNYDFENWASDGTFFNPVSWGTSNFSAMSIISFNTVFQETSDLYSGNSCAKLVTVEQNIGGDIVKVAGLITLGYFDVNFATRKAVVKGGIPCTSRPGLFSGYYKYSSSGIDSCIMSIYLTKYNTISNRADTLGLGIYSSSNQSEWTYFEAPVNYSSSENPDTMNIVILSSDTSLFVAGSTLYIDQLAIDVATSNNDIPVKNELYSVYPNPANDILNIELYTSIETFCKYSILNSSGVSVKQSDIYKNNEPVDISSFAPGIYFIKLTLKNHEYKESFIIY